MFPCLCRMSLATKTHLLDSKVSEFGSKTFSRKVLKFSFQLFVIIFKSVVRRSSAIFSMLFPCRFHLLVCLWTPQFRSLQRTDFASPDIIGVIRSRWMDGMRSLWGKQRAQGQTSPSWGPCSRLANQYFIGPLYQRYLVIFVRVPSDEIYRQLCLCKIQVIQSLYLHLK